MKNFILKFIFNYIDILSYILLIVLLPIFWLVFAIKLNVNELLNIIIVVLLYIVINFSLKYIKNEYINNFCFYVYDKGINKRNRYNVYFDVLTIFKFKIYKLTFNYTKISDNTMFIYYKNVYILKTEYIKFNNFKDKTDFIVFAGINNIINLDNNYDICIDNNKNIIDYNIIKNKIRLLKIENI